MTSTINELITEDDILRSNQKLKKLPKGLPFKFTLNYRIYTTPAAEGLPVVEYCTTCNSRYLFLHPTVLISPTCPSCKSSLQTIGPTNRYRNNPMSYLSEWGLDEKDIEVVKSVYKKYIDPILGEGINLNTSKDYNIDSIEL